MEANFVAPIIPNAPSQSTATSTEATRSESTFNSTLATAISKKSSDQEKNGPKDATPSDNTADNSKETEQLQAKLSSPEDINKENISEENTQTSFFTELNQPPQIRSVDSQQQPFLIKENSASIMAQQNPELPASQGNTKLIHINDTPDLSFMERISNRVQRPNEALLNSQNVKINGINQTAPPLSANSSENVQTVTGNNSNLSIFKLSHENTSPYQQSLPVADYVAAVPESYRAINISNQTVSSHPIESVQWSKSEPAKIRPLPLEKSLGLYTTHQTSEVVSKNTSVSTESIMASITDIAGELQKPQSLRNQGSTLRQDINNQYLDAKIQPPETNSQHKNQEQNLDPGKEQNNQNTTMPLSSKTVDSTAESNFQQSFSQTQSDKGLPSLNDTLKTGSPVFAPQVYEESVIHQINQKIRTNQILRDPKLVLKLHPAELGELKIDIQIKDGGVHASIVAQNQQVHDILDKNMPRLKALMEQQGLKVNEIIVSLDPNVPSEYNLFDEHLSQQGNEFNKRRSSQSKTTFNLLEEEDDSIEESPKTSREDVHVNVKI